MADTDDKALEQASKHIYTTLGEFFSDPFISGLCQVNPLAAGIATYIGGSYQQEQFKTLKNFLKLLDSKVKVIEEKYINKDFIQSPEGQRIIGKVFRGILNDNRQEKLEAMA